MWLNICPVCSKELLRTVNRELFRHVNVFTAAVVALAGIALRILVREDAALRLHDRTADDVLRGDKFQLRTLAIELLLNRLAYLRVHLAQGIHNAHKNSP